jgi:hypothetical protein
MPRIIELEKQVSALLLMLEDLNARLERLAKATPKPYEPRFERWPTLR